MFSRYRSATCVSTVAVGSLALLALAACVDPAGRFDQFASRVPDARQVAEGCPAISGPALPSLPNLTGTALFALKLSFVTTPVQLQATYAMTVTGSTGSLDITLKFLDAQSRTIVGDPIVVNDVPVAATGQYCHTIAQLNVPAAANPLGTGDAVAQNVIVAGNIKSADLACGDVSGMLTSPVPENIAGSSFGSVRAPDGATGNQLPAPVTACPAASDAGTIDAAH